MTQSEQEHPDGERLQKVLARAGVASRRRVEQLMQMGRVSVNGKIATEMGMRVHALRDIISVNGSVVDLKVDARYVMLHKPVGTVSSLSDEQGRPDISAYVEDIGDRVFNVGRLDIDTSGLLLLTNDGEVTHRLAHPSFEIDKVYTATVSGVVTPSEIALLLAGVELEDGIARADQAKIMGEPRRGMSIVELVLHSGKNRVVRRMLKAIGHPVKDLHRRQFGPLHLGGLKPGAWRDLTRVEVTNLLTMAYRDQVFIKEQGDDRDD